MPAGAERPASVLLWWLPVGAGGHVVRHTSRWWELAQARWEGRPPQRLFHAALEVSVDGGRFVIEMAPAWGVPRAADRGVTCTGPVGARGLGRSRFFRYEVRCWRDGTIPDRRWAEGPPALLSADAQVARAVVAGTRTVPALTWGRAAGGTRDMWNSNSLVSWLLRTGGAGLDGVRPPAGGRAPGWEAGLAVAGADRRSSPSQRRP